MVFVNSSSRFYRVYVGACKYSPISTWCFNLVKYGLCCIPSISISTPDCLSWCRLSLSFYFMLDRFVYQAYQSHDGCERFCVLLAYDFSIAVYGIFSQISRLSFKSKLRYIVREIREISYLPLALVFIMDYLFVQTYVCVLILCPDYLIFTYSLDRCFIFNLGFYDF